MLANLNMKKLNNWRGFILARLLCIDAIYHWDTLRKPPTFSDSDTNWSNLITKGRSVHSFWIYSLLNSPLGNLWICMSFLTPRLLLAATFFLIFKKYLSVCFDSQLNDWKQEHSEHPRRHRQHVRWPGWSAGCHAGVKSTACVFVAQPQDPGRAQGHNDQQHTHLPLSSLSLAPLTPYSPAPSPLSWNTHLSSLPPSWFCTNPSWCTSELGRRPSRALNIKDRAEGGEAEVGF